MDHKNKISLQEIGKELPFSVPDGYFEQFASQIEAQTTGSKTSLLHILKPCLYMAAMFIGLFIIGHTFYSIYQNRMDNKDSFYDTYLFSQIDDVSLIDLYVDEFNN